jgi:multiple sugar transport system substrate-binding protein
MMAVENLLQGRSMKGMICLVSILILVCKQSATEPTDNQPAESVTISLAFCEDITNHMTELLQEFNRKYPHIIVQMRPMSHNDLAFSETANRVDVREVFIAHFGNRDLLIHEKNKIIALDSFIVKDGSIDMADFYSLTVEAMTVDDKVWSIPFAVESEVMYYNKDLFDRFSIPSPEVGWTWEDFINTGLALRDSTEGIYGYSNIGIIWSMHLFAHMYGGTLLDNLKNPTRHTFDNPLIEEILEWYGSLFHEYDIAFPCNYPPIDDGERWRRVQDNAINAGKIGMWSETISFGSGWRFLNTGKVTLPMPDAVADTAMVGDVWAKGFAITTRSQHPDEAWKLVSFLSRQMYNLSLPVRRSIVASAEYKNWAGDDAAAIAEVVMRKGLPYYPASYHNYHEAIHILADAAFRVQTGQMTAEQAAEWAKNEADGRLQF